MASHLGDNGLDLDDWFANQICAAARGADGAPLAGIFVQYNQGAYIIVGARTYEDANADRSDTILYSDREHPPNHISYVIMTLLPYECSPQLQSLVQGPAHGLYYKTGSRADPESMEKSWRTVPHVEN
ncbi:hypothetical protein Daus18300_005723 [Diaporthe australafricana]|uniref:CMP/dCMP-type deaminase domain-containing protein n=1 Tax=Diaporthe australafricana TaxID=127596 RepID=A0ABR3WZJ5_9PEZI